MYNTIVAIAVVVLIWVPIAYWIGIRSERKRQAKRFRKPKLSEDQIRERLIRGQQVANEISREMDQAPIRLTKD